MFIEELLKKIDRTHKTLTKEDRKQLLIDARILDNYGFYDKRYFSAKTVAKSKNINRLSK